MHKFFFFLLNINNINFFLSISDQRRRAMSEYGFQQPKRRKGEFLYILLLNARESVLPFWNDNKIKQKINY